MLTLLGLYAIGITTMGGYRFDDYMRVHTVFNPLLIVVIWGSMLLVSNAIACKIGGVLSLSRKKRESSSSFRREEDIKNQTKLKPNSIYTIMLRSQRARPGEA